MDRAEVKIYLNSYRRIEERKRQVRERLDRIEERATSTTAKITGMPRATGTGDKVGRGAAGAADFQTELRRLESEAARAEVEVFFAIDAVEDADQAEVLNRHYIGGETFERIADAMGFSERWISELHGRGLDAVAYIIENAEQFGA